MKYEVEILNKLKALSMTNDSHKPNKIWEDINRLSKNLLRQFERRINNLWFNDKCREALECKMLAKLDCIRD